MNLFLKIFGLNKKILQLFTVYKLQNENKSYIKNAKLKWLVGLGVEHELIK